MRATRHAPLRWFTRVWLLHVWFLDLAILMGGGEEDTGERA